MIFLLLLPAASIAVNSLDVCDCEGFALIIVAKLGHRLIDI
jgi:hypothetical protein